MDTRLLPWILLPNGPKDTCRGSCYQNGPTDSCCGSWYPLAEAVDSATQWADVDPAESKGKHGVWDPRPEFSITSPYVHSRVDSNTFTMGNLMPESTLSLSQGLMIGPLTHTHSLRNKQVFSKIQKQNYLKRPKRRYTCIHISSPIIFWLVFFNVRYSTLLHLPSLRYHCVGRCWDRTQDCYDFSIDSQTL